MVKHMELNFSLPKIKFPYPPHYAGFAWPELDKIYPYNPV